MTVFAICCYDARDDGGGLPPPALWAVIFGGVAAFYGFSYIRKTYKARREPGGAATEMPRTALYAFGLGSLLFLIGVVGLIHG